METVNYSIAMFRPPNLKRLDAAHCAVLYLLTEPPVPQTDQSCAQVKGIEHAMYICRRWETLTSEGCIGRLQFSLGSGAGPPNQSHIKEHEVEGKMILCVSL